MRRVPKAAAYEDAPHFTQPVHSVVATEGSCAAFEVVLTGQKPMNVQWLKDGAECQENPNYEITENDHENRYSLVIAEVFDEDSGRFTCVARNSAGHASSAAELVVQARPSPPTCEPMLVDTRVNSGESCTFGVNITGTPKPIIKWYREGAEIFNNQDFQITEDGCKHELTIVRTYGEDSGDYTVAAVNVAGRVTSTCHLEVYDVDAVEMSQSKSRSVIQRGPPPGTMPKPDGDLTEVRESFTQIIASKTTIKRELVAEVPSALSFVKHVEAPGAKRSKDSYGFNDPVLPPWKVMQQAATVADPNPEIVRTQTPQGDIIIEKGSNTSYSNTESTPGTMAPSFTKTLEAASSQERDATLFEAFVQAFPPPEVKWYREGAFIEHNNDFVQSYDQNTGCCRLLIRETFVDDAGRFTVAVQNEAGAASCSATLTVRSSPTPAASHRVEGITGDEASVTDGMDGFESQEIVDGGEYVTGVSEIESTDIEAEKEFEGQFAQTALSPVHEEGSKSPEDPKAPTVAAGPGAPRFSVALPDFTKLVEGSANVFQCIVQSSPPAHVYWVKDGKPLMAGYRVKIESNDQSGVYKLALTMVFPEDAGEYTIFARNNNGEISSSTQFMPEEQMMRARRSTTPSAAAAGALTSDSEGPGRGRGQTTRRQEAYYKGQTKISPQKSPARSDSRHSMSRARGASASPSPSRRLADMDQSDIEKLYRPVFLKKPIDKECRETGTTRLDCKVTGRPLPIVSWFKDGNQVYDDCYHHMVVKEDGVRSLIIENASPQDTGEYTIVAKNKAGKSVCSVKLTVIAKEEISKPKILEKPQSSRIQAGEGLKLEVFASGNPSPEIVWIKENNVIQPDKHPWFQIEGVDGHGLLTIHDAKKHLHDGWYTATAVNRAGRDITRFRINVTDAEVYQQEEVHRIRISKSRSRSRDVGAEFEQKQRQAQQQEDQAADMPVVKRMPVDMFDDNDLYDKSNPQKPRFKTTIEPIKTTTLGVAHFECYLVPIGDPTMRVQWLLDGKPLDMANRIQPMLEFGYCALDFTSCFPRDSGVLTCRAENSTHYAECSTTLIVKEAKENLFSKAASMERESVSSREASIPKISKRRPSEIAAQNVNVTCPEISMAPESITCDEGRRAKFAARVHGHPTPRVTWYINGKAIMKSKRFAVKNDGMCKLEIREVKGYDAGEVKVVASNEAGTVQHTCSLDVNAKQDFRAVLAGSKGKKSKTPTTPQPRSVTPSKAFNPYADMLKKTDRSESRMSTTSHATNKSDEMMSDELKKKFGRLTDEERIKEAAFGVDKRPKSSEPKDRAAGLLKDARSDLRTPTPDIRVPTPSQEPFSQKMLQHHVEPCETPGGTQVGTPAVIKEKIYDSIVTEGHAISFKVKFEGKPEATVQWLRNGQIIESSEREYIHFPMEDCCELVLREAQVQDAGMITVCVYNKHGGEQCDSVLQVRSTPHVPMIIDGPKNTECQANHVAHFEVTISHPEEIGYWTKNGQAIDISDASKFHETKMGPKRRLSIPDLVGADAGVFCYVYAGMTSEAAELCVHSGQPEFIEDLCDMTILSGEVATFQVVLSQENAEVQWLQNGRNVEASDRIISVCDKKKHILIIEAVSASDSGTWSAVCGVRTSTSQLKVAQVSIKKELKSQEISEGQTAEFECAVSEEQYSSGQWYFNGRELDPNERMGIEYFDGVSRLIIRGCCTSDAGSYQFIAGDCTSTGALIVNEVNIDQGLTNQTLQLGSEAHFSVHLSAQASGKWFHNGIEVESNDTFTVAHDGALHSLTVGCVVDAHAGNYVFKAGSKESAAQLIISDSEFARALPSEKHSYAGARIMLDLELSLTFQKKMESGCTRTVKFNRAMAFR
jgi:titin